MAKAVLTVTAANQTIAFGGTVAPYTATITGFVNGDTAQRGDRHRQPDHLACDSQRRRHLSDHRGG